jgi:hypothetical protein
MYSELIHDVAFAAPVIVISDTVVEVGINRYDRYPNNGGIMISIHFLLPLSFPILGCARLELAISKTWSNSRSLDQQVIIDNGVTLTIKGESPESPITIDLDDIENVGGGFKIFPEASLYLENVILTRTKNLERSIDAVSFVDETGGFLRFKNVRCEHMHTCIIRFCCDGNHVRIQESIFVNNSVAIEGTAKQETIQNSLFVNNDLALSGGNWIVEDSVFLRNSRASQAENTKFIRTLFMENEKAVQDPMGSPSPFLEDSLFFRNKHAILPSSAAIHASMYRVSFIENQVGIFCTSKLTTLDQVNFINNTEWNIVYAGIEASDVGNNIYWNEKSRQVILTKLFDSHKFSGGGTVEFSEFSKIPYLHDYLVFLLRTRPSALLNKLDKYFRRWENTYETTTTAFDTSFDFTKLQEWSEIPWDMQFTIQAQEPATELEVLDAANVIVEIPEDVAIATDPPINESQHPSHTTTIQIQDEHNAFFWLSIAFNICFLWLLFLLLYEKCCRGYFFQNDFDHSLTSEEKQEFLQTQHDEDKATDNPLDVERILEDEEEGEPQQPQQFYLDAINDSSISKSMSTHTKRTSKPSQNNNTLNKDNERSFKII